MLGRMQRRHALDIQGGGADAFDFRAHLHEAGGEIGDLGLAGGILDHRVAAGEHGGHQRIMGGADRDLAEMDAAADQALRGLGDDIAAVELDIGAERLQRREMKIDGPRADGAAAGQGHRGLAAAGQDRRQHPEARPHARDHLVRRRGVDDLGRGEAEGLAVAGALADALAGNGDVDAVIAEDAAEQRDVGEARHAVERQRLAGEQAGDHQGQRSVLGTADGYGAVQALAADNADTIHDDVGSLARSRPLAPANSPFGRPTSSLGGAAGSQSTLLGSGLSPLFGGRLRGFSGAALRLAFQQVSAKLLLQPGAAGLGRCVARLRLPAVATVVLRLRHQGRHISCAAPARRPPNVACSGVARSLAWRRTRLAPAATLWQFARRTRGRPESFEGFASRADPPVSIRRRSSVVERVIGNDEVLSSILSGGTSFPENLA